MRKYGTSHNPSIERLTAPQYRWNVARHDEIIFVTSMSTRKIVLVSTLALLTIVAVGVGVSVVLLNQLLEKERMESSSEAREAYADSRALISPESNLDFDPRDERKLMRNSEEVFVGEVERLITYGGNDPTPFLEGWTSTARFAVRVEKVRRDESPDNELEAGQTVTVNQLSVPPPDTKATVCFGNGFPGDGYVAAQELKAGNRYVFATEYYPRKEWHEIRVDPFGWMVLSEDAPPDEAPEAGDGNPPCDMETNERDQASVSP